MPIMMLTLNARRENSAMASLKDAQQRNSAGMTRRTTRLEEPIDELTGDLVLAVRKLRKLAAVLRAAGKDSVTIECEDD